MPEAESHTSTVRGPESSHTTTGYDLADGQPAAVNVRQGEARFDAEEEREAALRAELQGVRSINQVLEGVLSSLDRAKENMAVVSRTVQSASALLDTWIQVLSQTEHNQRLMLNPSWQGASQDVVDIEKETKFRQQAAQRKEMEEQRRREARKLATEQRQSRNEALEV
ncbi:MAG: hypothetical protein M1826_004801 [Phylliscum demangeonii]|nr:MAG: hypothetical protein M1826_004801 [Phylliscum demangeonii]